MSIPVTCESCFQSFRVKDQFAGRTIRCKECGAPMPVSRDIGFSCDDFPPVRHRKRTRKKRPAEPPKIVIIIIACVIIAGLLGAGMWVSANLENNRSEPRFIDRTVGKAPDERVPEVFTNPPIDRRIRVTGQDWTPENSLLRRLRSPERVGLYEVRLPEGMKRVQNGKLAADGRTRQYRWVRRSSPPHNAPVTTADRQFNRFEMILLIIRERGAWSFATTKGEIAGSYAQPHVVKNLVEQGTLAGHPCFRKTSVYRDQNTGTLLYDLTYIVADADGRLINIGVTTPNAPGTEIYRLLECAVHTIRKHGT